MIRTLFSLFALLLLSTPQAWADFEQDLSAAGSNMQELRELRLKAGMGDAVAQLNMGIIFFKGQQTEQDYAESAKWFKLAAQQGVAEAQYNLGMMYATGQGVTQDHTESVAWYRRAAQQNLAIAQLNLGVACSYGEGTTKDEAQALKWFRLAADQGEALAQFNLAVMYANGQGIAKNLDESYRWARLSAANGYGIADALIDDLNQRMNPNSQTDKPAIRRYPVEENIYIQLGAFRAQQQAADFSEKMQAKLGDLGKPYSLTAQDGWVRIQLGPYASHSEAHQVAARLKLQLGYEPKLKQR